MSLSMVDIAYQVLNDAKKSMNFRDLWQNVSSRMNISMTDETSKMSQFFTNLSLDNRFALIDNTWDIRARHKLEEVIIDTSTLELEEDEEEENIIDDSKSYDDSEEEEE